MIHIDVRTDAAMLIRGLTAFQRDQLPFITSLALNMVGKSIIEAQKREMVRVFDRPVPWTLNSLFLRPGNKRDPRIEVGFKDFAGKGTPAGKYLQFQINGGGRNHKRFENALIAGGAMLSGQYAVPTRRVVLDNYGNVPKGVITKILSDLGSSRDSTQNRNAGKRSRGKLRNLTFFAITHNNNGLAPGIYLAEPGRAREQRLFFAYVKRPNYTKRYDWPGVTKRTVEREFASAFRQAAARAEATGRRRAA